MVCEVAREALSARIDGEREPVPRGRVDEHLAACAPCREWYFVVRGETQRLRAIAGRPRPPVTAVTGPSTPDPQRRRGTPPAVWRWILGTAGVLQSAVALLQAFGVEMGLQHAAPGDHLLNESTAWSLALGAAMTLTALRPVAAAGLGVVLIAFTAVLTGYVVADTMSSSVTVLRALSHLPIAVGSVAAVMLWLRCGTPRPAPPTAHGTGPGDITLPDHASRGRRRAPLRPTDDSAA